MFRVHPGEQRKIKENKIRYKSHFPLGHAAELERVHQGVLLVVVAVGGVGGWWLVLVLVLVFVFVLVLGVLVLVWVSVLVLLLIYNIYQVYRLQATASVIL